MNIINVLCGSFIINLFYLFLKPKKDLKNVFVKNLESEALSIQESYVDELTIFTYSGLFIFNSENKNRVKTKLKF